MEAVTKGEMMSLLDGIAGGSKDQMGGTYMTLQQLLENRERILEAAQAMAKFYRESPIVHEDIRKYYERDFARIEGARSGAALLAAIESLRNSMYWQ